MNDERVLLHQLRAHLSAGLIQQDDIRFLRPEAWGALMELGPGCFDYFCWDGVSVAARPGVWDSSPDFESTCSELLESMERIGVDGVLMDDQKLLLMVRMAADLAGRIMPRQKHEPSTAHIEAAMGKLMLFLWLVDATVDECRRVFGPARSSAERARDRQRGYSEHPGHRCINSLTDLYMGALEGSSEHELLAQAAAASCEQLFAARADILGGSEGEQIRAAISGLCTGPALLLREFSAALREEFENRQVTAGRFIQSMYEHLRSRHDEIDRCDDLDMEAYRKVRISSSAVEPVFWIRLEVAMRISEKCGTGIDYRSLEYFLDRYPEVAAHLLDHLNMQICTINDLAGVVKDVGEGDTMNCAFVAARDMMPGVDLDPRNVDPVWFRKAIRECVDMANRDLAEVLGALRAMVDLDPVAAYLFHEAARDFLMGHLFWVWGEHASWRYRASFPFIRRILDRDHRQDALVSALDHPGLRSGELRCVELLIETSSLNTGEFGGPTTSGEIPGVLRSGEVPID